MNLYQKKIAYASHFRAKSTNTEPKFARCAIDEVIENTPTLRSMIFDMKGVTFIDSTGLGFVLGRYKKLKAMHAELLLENVPRQVDKVFLASGVYRYVPVVE